MSCQLARVAAALFCRVATYSKDFKYQEDAFHIINMAASLKSAQPYRSIENSINYRGELKIVDYITVESSALRAFGISWIKFGKNH